MERERERKTVRDNERHRDREINKETERRNGIRTDFWEVQGALPEPYSLVL